MNLFYLNKQWNDFVSASLTNYLNAIKNKDAVKIKLLKFREAQQKINYNALG